MESLEYDLIYVPLSSELFQVQFPHWNTSNNMLKFLQLDSIYFKAQQEKLKMEFVPSKAFQNIDEDEIKKTRIVFESSKKNIKGHQLLCIPDHEKKVIYAFSLGPALEMHRVIESNLQVMKEVTHSLEEDFSEISKRKDFKRFLDSKLRSHNFQRKILESEIYHKATLSKTSFEIDKSRDVAEVNFLSPEEYIHNLTV